MPSPEKITVRRAEPDDYEALHKIFSGRQAVEGTLQLPLPTVEEWRRRLSEPSEATYQLVACVGGEVVGELTLWTYPTVWRRRHVGRIGMAVRADWQSKGIGTALMEVAVDLADNWLGLTRIELEVYTDNRAGIALYEKFGFEMEGTHRRFAFRDGEYVDAYSMARIK
jgi:L-phenylalanine/L-methionine N-acetyltransferase